MLHRRGRANVASKRIRSLVVVALVGLYACKSADPDEGRAGRGLAPVTVFTNGTIYVDPLADPVRSLVVDEATGRVVAFDLSEVEPGRPVHTVDLGGGVAIPGLQDAHGHVSGLGGALEQVDLVGCSSYEELVERVAARAATQAPGTWITGRGWDQTLWPGAQFPDHEALSRAVANNPVLVRRVDGHAALANAQALEIAGLLDADPIPTVEGGRVVVNEVGRPTGVLIDTAMGFVGRHVPSVDRATRRRRILLAQEHLLAEGLVCIHDMGVSASEAALFEELEASGELKLRILSYLWGNGGLPDDVLARYPRAHDRDPASTHRVVGTKLMLDGALGSRGAALLEPYTDAPQETGLARMSAEEFQQLVDTFADAGLQPATHAIGDRANRIVLDAYEARIRRDPAFKALQPRVEHAQIVSQADWRRFEQLGIVASMQPTHATSDMRWAEERVGAERARGAYAWRRLASDVTRLAFGSDFPVEPSNPIGGLYAARTRQDKRGNPAGGWQPEQRLNGAEAVAAFTYGAARAVGEGADRGRLHVGYFADMTVLSIDPIRATPANLLEAEVLMTVIDGQVVYAKD